MPRLLGLLLVLPALCCGADALQHDFNYQITEEQYHQMPSLFHLDDYEGCLSQQHAVYCVGSFELTPTSPDNPLFQVMKRYSANWVDNFNHTRLHRGLCVSRRCPDPHHSPEDRFTTCVNDSMMEQYALTASMYKLDYCQRGEAQDAEEEGELAARAVAGVLAALLGLTLLSTALDFVLPEQGKKAAAWVLSWSLRGTWRDLTATPAYAHGPLQDIGDLRVCDGLRALSMVCIVLEHVVWIGCTTYQVNPRFTEKTRDDTEALLLTNSTLLVQIFFLLSSFLLAHKLLQQSRHGPLPSSTLFTTLVNRIIRISPGYWLVVAFAATWWSRLGTGPLWAPLVTAEAGVCRHKWWAQMLYLNNVVYPDEKCLIQTWYLAADMQLYAVALLLTLVLVRHRRLAVPLLASLLLTSVVVQFGLAYLWTLQPTFITHNPEAVRAMYAGDASFNWLYQSPLGNLPGSLAGLLLAHVHHDLLDHDVRLSDYKWVSWVTRCGAPLAAVWMLVSPLLIGLDEPGRLSSAVLAALDRPVFAVLVAAALLGSFHNIHTPWRDWLAWGGWRLPARLSYCVLLLHMLINKVLVAARLQPTQLTHLNVIYEWVAVCVLSYLAAIPLALLAELPPLRLHRALSPPPPADDKPRKDHS